MTDDYGGGKTAAWWKQPPTDDDRLVELERWLRPRLRPGLMVEEDDGRERPIKMLESLALHAARKKEDDARNV